MDDVRLVKFYGSCTEPRLTIATEDFGRGILHNLLTDNTATLSFKVMMTHQTSTHDEIRMPIGSASNVPNVWRPFINTVHPFSCETSNHTASS